VVRGEVVDQIGQLLDDLADALQPPRLLFRELRVLKAGNGLQLR
jgi:hypothetical protein